MPLHPHIELAHWFLIAVSHSPFCFIYHSSSQKHISPGKSMKLPLEFKKNWVMPRVGGLCLHLDAPSDQDILQDWFAEVKSRSLPAPERPSDTEPRSINHVHTAAEKCSRRVRRLYVGICLNCYDSVPHCSSTNCVSEGEIELDLHSDHLPQHQDIISLLHTLVI